ncbi:hypothetical protein BGX27_002963, partial [Mortierella sp. AM989]
MTLKKESTLYSFVLDDETPIINLFKSKDDQIQFKQHLVQHDANVENIQLSAWKKEEIKRYILTREQLSGYFLEGRPLDDISSDIPMDDVKAWRLFRFGMDTAMRNIFK